MEENLEREQRGRHFTRALLNDLQALEAMLERHFFETEKRRVGAEQELFLVDGSSRAAPIAQQVLQDLGDSRFTTELALFNLEANLSPREFRGDCLSAAEEELCTLVQRARSSARKYGGDVVLTGILPTLRQEDLGLNNMTPVDRYRALDRETTRLSGGEFRIGIKGVDELKVRHKNVMVEACNTSFQLHFQVAPEEFASLYNIAQLITAPVLAVAANSPLFLGRRLWHETRIALFQDSVDSRSDVDVARGAPARVSFGDDWVKESVLELYREQIARFRVMLAEETGPDSMLLLEAGEIPPLTALCMHNGTVYRWNRACYGVSEGKPHLRIENRALPAGPTPRDEVANAALYFGLLASLSNQFSDISQACGGW